MWAELWKKKLKLREVPYLAQRCLPRDDSKWWSNDIWVQIPCLAPLARLLSITGFHSMLVQVGPEGVGMLAPLLTDLFTVGRTETWLQNSLRFTLLSYIPVKPEISAVPGWAQRDGLVCGLSHPAHLGPALCSVSMWLASSFHTLPHHRRGNSLWCYLVDLSEVSC